jgi:hypothetical protein
MRDAIRISLKRLVCRTETNEPSASDEPYVIVFAVDVAKPDTDDIDDLGDLPNFVEDFAKSLVPSTHTTLYGPWSNTDAGETKVTDDFQFGVPGGVVSQQRGAAVWHKPVEDASHILLIAGLMENDEANIANVRPFVHTVMTASLVTYWADYIEGVLSRNALADRLVIDMQDALSGVAVTGYGVEPVFPVLGVFPNDDDLIAVREIRISARDVKRANLEGDTDLAYDVASETGILRREFTDGQARYELFFDVVSEPMPDDDTASGGQALTAPSTTFICRPSLLSTRPGHLDVFGRGLDDRFYVSSWNGQAWSTWSAIGSGTFRSGPAAGVLRLTRAAQPLTYLVGKGKDHRMWEAIFREGAWGNWRPIGSRTFLSGPAIAGTRTPYLFAIGDDRRLWHCRKGTRGWSDWLPIGEGTFRSAPTAVVWNGGQLQVFAVGDDRNVYHAWHDGDRWHAWEPIWKGSTFRSAPAVASWGTNRLDLFAVGDDERMFHCTWTAQGWSKWAADLDSGNAIFASAPAVISTQPDRLDVVAFGKDHKPYHNAWLGDHWSGWLRDTPEGVFK